MKKYILLFAFSLFTIIGKAQTVFDKYDGLDNVTSIVVNKKMFELMSKVKMEASDKDAQKYLNLIKKLEHLRVFKTTGTKTTADMRVNVDKYVGSAALSELMRVNENGRNAKIFVKSAGNNGQVQELLMFIEGSGAKGNETILMSLTGDFSLSEISLLTERMKIPGGEVLDKAGK